ncbi:unnamed protein product [Dovyalis caffra]|uniref:Uncharacterized protein n=1 Tax=Dovyalis caffra TaxID=77055 RepID=A0AAV1SN62_9ROSI|nr:unnamed protein product [Dovyalis caffra]
MRSSMGLKRTVKEILETRQTRDFSRAGLKLLRSQESAKAELIQFLAKLKSVVAPKRAIGFQNSVINSLMHNALTKMVVTLPPASPQALHCSQTRPLNGSSIGRDHEPFRLQRLEKNKSNGVLTIL